MMRKLLGRLAMFSGVAGPLLLFQQGCMFGDPDLYFRGFLLALNETLVFALDNVVVGL